MAAFLSSFPYLKTLDGMQYTKATYKINKTTNLISFIAATGLNGNKS